VLLPENMLSPLRPLASVGGARGGVLIPPPKWFNPIQGEIKGAHFTSARPPASRGTTAARRAGIAYEKRVLKFLEREFSSRLRRSPAIGFYDDAGKRLAIPDALLYLDSDRIAILEIKISHRSDSFFQLNNLYRPLIERLVRPGVKVSCVEICRSFDPSVAYPCTFDVIQDIESASDFSVFPWKL
jgi:hypothetical protein